VPIPPPAVNVPDSVADSSVNEETVDIVVPEVNVVLPSVGAL
jgi:hypothetical protein